MTKNEVLQKTATMLADSFFGLGHINAATARLNNTALEFAIKFQDARGLGQLKSEAETLKRYAEEFLKALEQAEAALEEAED